jgi:hypothetical protein
MPDPSVDPSQLATDAVQRAKAAANAVYDTVQQHSNDPRLAAEHAARAIKDVLGSGGVLKTLTDAGFSLASDVLALFFKIISGIRHATTHNFDETTTEVLNEFLGTAFSPDALKTNGGPEEILQKCTKIGTEILDRLEFEFTKGKEVTPESGAEGARTFAGYAVNFAIQNAIITLIGSCIPETRLDEVRELGVEVAGNLGLGAQVAAALAPLVNNAIVKPYNRQLSEKYQMDLLGAPQLARAALVGRMKPADAKQLLRQHGLSDDQIDELIAQLRPRLRAQEWNLLTAHGMAPADSDALEDSARGMPADWVKLRQQAETWHRLQRPRQRALQAVISQISSGFLQPADLDKLLTQLQVPDDEQTLWRLTAGYLFERTRKRISQGDMLFLFEAAQVTQDEVREWAREEGYSAQDQERIVLFFELKAAEASHKTSGGAAARAAHLHKEHIAYVTDEITGIFGRAPTTAELNYWVQLLDTGERTKHDFVTELRALDPSGPAVPQQPPA